MSDWENPEKWKPDVEKISKAYEIILEEILPGVWRDDPNAKDTPLRAAKGFLDLTRGYAQDPRDFITEFKEERYKSIVVVRDIPYFSLCSHHLLPFYGKAHIAYIPDGQVLGLSKFARITHCYSRRLQLQEKMTEQIADAFETCLHPKGVAVVIDGTHLCMSMRGVECEGAQTVTSALRGCFMDEPEARLEVMSLLNNSK